MGGRATQVAERLLQLAGKNPDEYSSGLDEFNAKDVAVGIASFGVGGGGSAAFAGALIKSSASASVASGGQCGFDTVEVDTDGFFDSNSQGFIIPADKAGIYLVGLMLKVSASEGQADFAGVLVGDDTDVVFTAVADSTHAVVVSGSVILTYAAAGTISPTLVFNGAGEVSVQGGTNGSRVFCQYLGSAS